VTKPLPRRAKISRPFLMVNGVDLSPYVLRATTDRIKNTIDVEFDGFGHPVDLSPVVGKDVALELRPSRAPASPDNPALIASNAVLSRRLGQHMTFVLSGSR
jgi:hypothetical protein